MEVSIKNMVIGLLPFHKRLSKRFAFLQIFGQKADEYMQLIREYRVSASMLAYTNCQRFRLEKHLNDKFDNELRRIAIVDASDNGIVIGYESETDFIVIGFESEADYYAIFRYQSEDSSGGNGITIVVPSGVNPEIVFGDVRKFSLAGIAINVQTI